MAKPSGFILYQGPSEIDGAPIVVIATGYARSSNRKTGAMVQTWILRSDLPPVEAVRSGCDSSVCGDCPHRGEGFRNRSCYVNVGQAPGAVYRAFQRGRYPVAPDLAAVGAGRRLRVGSYGDPGAVPAAIWQAFTSQAAGRTGYTHRWAHRPDLAPLCMASVETPAEAATAQLAGFRTFRVGPEPAARGEITCPASAEAGHRRTCDTCLACNGRRSPADLRASVTIRPHGPAARATLRRI